MKQALMLICTVGLVFVSGCDDDDEPLPGDRDAGADVADTTDDGDDDAADAVDAPGDAASDVTPDADTGEQPLRLQLTEVASGLTSPVAMATPGDGSGRLFVVDQTGPIYVIGVDGQLEDEPFADFSDKIVELRQDYDERGVLGLAFHPDFEQNGRVFVYYSAPLRQTAPDNFDHTNVLSEFTVADDGTLDLTSEKELIAVAHPYFNHNGGTVAFGPDGFLYLSIGDGGNRNDVGIGHPEMGNGQDTSTILGNILRIDVDNGDPYAIPSDNPFADTQGVDEIFAWGFRNPYRFAFDSQTGRLFVADAGQDLMEEVDIVEVGNNYGWNIKEGTLCFNEDDATNPPEQCADTGPNGNPLIEPILTFTRPESAFAENPPTDIIAMSDVHGLVVVGGQVYRGDNIPQLDGRYIFGSWGVTRTEPSGEVYLGVEEDGEWSLERAPFVEADDDNSVDQFVLAFGQDADGEVYLLGTQNVGPSGTTGRVFRIDAVQP